MTKKEYENIMRTINECRDKYENDINRHESCPYEDGWVDGVLEGLYLAEYIIDKYRRKYRKEK